MSHQAIARKWRPKLFEEIVGQAHVTRTVQNAIRLGRIHHAFLLTGARGVGKTSAARILARALNCERGPVENPCNECPSCLEMLAGTYPDLMEIDAASHNSVDDIRDLVDKVRYAPQRGRKKVYVIDEVHMVSKAGFNALLKTLEEPPDHVVFILATTDPQQLLDTVISRCQRFDFKMIPVRTIYERLRFVAEQEGISVPESSLMVIAREGGGSMRDAQSLLDQVLSFSEGSVTEEEVAEILGFIDRSILYEVLEGALRADAARAIQALAKVATFGYDIRTFSEQLLEAVRNVHVVSQIRDGGSLLDLPDDEISRLQTLAEGMASETLQRHFDVLAAGVDALHRSEQPFLILEMSVVKMASIRPFVDVRVMIDRLEALERRLRKAGGNNPGSGSPPRPTDGRGALAEPPRPEASVAHISSPAAPPKAPTPPPAPPKAPTPPPAPPKAPTPPPGPPRAPTPPPAPPKAPTPPPAPPKAPTPPPAPPKAPTPPPAPPKAPTPPPAPPKAPTPPPSPPRAPTPPPAPPRAPTPPPAPPKAPTTPLVPGIDSSSDSGSVETTSPVAPPDPDLSALAIGGAESERISLPIDRPDPPGSDLCDAPRWRRFVHKLFKDEVDGQITAPLSVAGFMGTDSNRIVLGFLGTLPQRQMETLHTSAILQNLLHEAFGEGTTLVWVTDREGKSGRTLLEEFRLQTAERRSELETKAMEHVAVERVKEIFPGAEIRNVYLPENLEITDVR